jgi:hypothetical protein
MQLEISALDQTTSKASKRSKGQIVSHRVAAAYLFLRADGSVPATSLSRGIARQTARFRHGQVVSSRIDKSSHRPFSMHLIKRAVASIPARRDNSHLSPLHGALGLVPD